MATVTFNITGTYIQTQVTDYIKEGNLTDLAELIDSFGMEVDTTIMSLLDGTFLFTGSSRNDDLNLELNSNPIENWEGVIYTFIKSIGLTDLNEPNVLENIASYIEDKKAKELITPNTLKAMLNKYPSILSGYGVEKMKSFLQLLSSKYCNRGNFSAIIDRKGDIYPCHYESHHDIVPLLVFAGILDGYEKGFGDFIRSVHGEHCYISNNRIMNRMDKLTLNICHTLLDMTEFNLFDKNGSDAFPRILRQYSLILNKGNKYGMLHLMKHLGYNTPKIYDNPSLVDTESLIVRTSPNKSMPGVLNSYNCTKGELDNVIAKMENDYNELCSDSSNVFNYFIQERVVGINGVATVSSYNPSKTLVQPIYDVNVSLSENQGDIVNGSDGDDDYLLKQKISKFSRDLSRKFNNIFNFQIEFVVTDDEEIVILQFRILPKDLIEDKTDDDITKDFEYAGKIFKLYDKKFKLEDAIICENVMGLKPDDLTDKKLIVTAQKSNNAHILSLAISRGISVVYEANISLYTSDIIFKNDYRVVYLKVK